MYIYSLYCWQSAGHDKSFRPFVAFTLFGARKEKMDIKIVSFNFNAVFLTSVRICFSFEILRVRSISDTVRGVRPDSFRTNGMQSFGFQKGNGWQRRKL